MCWATHPKLVSEWLMLLLGCHLPGLAYSVAVQWIAVGCGAWTARCRWSRGLVDGAGCRNRAIVGDAYEIHSEMNQKRCQIERRAVTRPTATNMLGNIWQAEVAACLHAREREQ